MMKPLNRAGTWWVMLLCWATLLFYFSSQPGSGHPLSIPHFDKVQHFGYFFVGGLVLQRALGLFRPALKPGLCIVIGAIVAALVGASDEYHQTFTPGRSGNDPWDWLADTLGGTAAGLFFARWFSSKAR
jgi:VanZ family protein